MPQAIAWLAFACVASACAGSNSLPTLPTSVSLPRSLAAPPNTPQPRPLGSLFAGANGSCRIDTPGQVHCWGAVPKGLTQLAQSRAAARLFFSHPSKPYCVIDAKNNAYCQQDCQPPLPCLQPMGPVLGVTRILREDPLLVRGDGSACVPDGEGSCVDVEVQVSGETPVDLNQAVVTHDARLVLPDFRYCREGAWSRELVCYAAQHHGEPTSFRVASRGFHADAKGRVWMRLIEQDEDDESLDLDAAEDLEDRDALAPDPPQRAAFEQLPGFSRVTQLVASTHELCGARAQGPPLCRHAPTPGLSNTGKLRTLAQPTCVAGLVAGARHVCAQSCDNQTFCWGSNDQGQLLLAPPPSDVNVLAGLEAQQLAAGRAHTCALTSNRLVVCWGGADDRALGSDLTGVIRATPQPVPLPGPARSIAAGASTTCAVLVDGRLVCWGKNEHGQARPAQPSLGELPAVVSGVRNAAEVAPGRDTTCARAEGKVYCWGSNQSGALGVGHDRTVAHVVQVPGLSQVTDIDVGKSAACAVASTGDLMCWGYTVRSEAPRPMPGFKDVVSVTIGDDSLCALTRQGRVLCQAHHKQPPRDMGIQGATQIVEATGSSYEGMCALRQHQSTSCWGAFQHRPLRQALEHTSQLRWLAMGEAHACSVDQQQQVTCRGADNVGQLASGRLLMALEPILVPMPWDTTAGNASAK